MQPIFRGLAVFIHSPHVDEIVPRLLVTVSDDGVAVFGERLSVAIGLRFLDRSSIAEIPTLFPMSVIKGSYLKRNFLSRLQPRGGRTGKVKTRRQALRIVEIVDLHSNKIIVAAAL